MPNYSILVKRQKKDWWEYVSSKAIYYVLCLISAAGMAFSICCILLNKTMNMQASLTLTIISLEIGLMILLFDIIRDRKKRGQNYKTAAVFYVILIIITLGLSYYIFTNGNTDYLFWDVTVSEDELVSAYSVASSNITLLGASTLPLGTSLILLAKANNANRRRKSTPHEQVRSLMKANNIDLQTMIEYVRFETTKLEKEKKQSSGGKGNKS